MLNLGKGFRMQHVSAWVLAQLLAGTRQVHQHTLFLEVHVLGIGQDVRGRGM